MYIEPIGGNYDLVSQGHSRPHPNEITSADKEESFSTWIYLLGW